MKINYTPINMLYDNKDNFDMLKKACILRGIKNAKTLTPQIFIDSLMHDKSLFEEGIDLIQNLFASKIVAKDKNFANKILNNEVSFDAELLDITLFPTILGEWSKAKQVYKPDPDFADALLHTKKLCISKSMISHLPYNLFYIDLSDCQEFAPIDGVMVYIKLYDNNEVDIAMYSITKDLTYFSFYVKDILDENDCLVIDYEKMGYSNYNQWKPFSTIDTSIENTKLNRSQVYMFALQMIAYLSIDEPQLTESDLTKHTYRKPSSTSQIKNKWSEVRIQDVGIRYGSDFRKSIREYKERNASEITNKRKSPIPHLRCAHWHLFRVGKGRKEIKLLWVEPIFVGNGESKDVIVHKVKK